MKPDPRVIVITGSTRGIGYGLADSFLARGCRVVVSSRVAGSVEETGTQLSAKHAADRIFAAVCDVTQVEQVQALWDSAEAHFGQIDIWINNAGLSQAQTDFWEHPAEELRQVVTTNILGAMYGGKIALRGMLRQGFGSLYNMEGLGSDGRRVEGLTLYGSTKRALRYLTDSWAEEVRGTGVLVGALLPGMVVTRFLTDRYADVPPDEWRRARQVFNVIADRVETVTPWLADKVLANDRNGVRFQWLTPGKLMGRFLLAGFRKRDLFQDTP